MKKSIVCIVLSALVFCVNIEAKTIGFSCIHNAEAPNKSNVLTTVMETALFDQCFDKGFIVTGTEHHNGGFEYYKNEAAIEKIFESSLDYIIAIYSEYKPLIKNGNEEIIWEKLNWKVIDFSSHTVIYQGTIIPKELKDKDIIKKAHSIGTMIAQSVLREVLTRQ